MRATISLIRNGFEEEAVTFGYPRERVFRQAARVRCGSKAKVPGFPCDVRFAPDKRTFVASYFSCQQRTHAPQQSLSIRSPRQHGRAMLARYRTRTPSQFDAEATALARMAMLTRKSDVLWRPR